MMVAYFCFILWMALGLFVSVPILRKFDPECQLALGILGVPPDTTFVGGAVRGFLDGWNVVFAAALWPLTIVVGFILEKQRPAIMEWVVRDIERLEAQRSLDDDEEYYDEDDDTDSCDHCDCDLNARCEPKTNS